ncbi:MAG: hypothetical protein LH630_05615 [Actinomycetia bacterium]|nr:hypothetical protein [Actinomycetes bacterium]
MIARIQRVGVIVGLASAALVASLLPPTNQAWAEDTIIEIPLSSNLITAPIVLEPTIVSGETQGFEISLPSGSTTDQAATQCIDVPGIGRSCIGTATDVDLTPLDVTGGEDLAPLVKWSDEARGALEWMIPEGVEFVRAYYDVPSDDRILKYARPQLRNYMVDRILQIMDKKVYGVSLTDDEKAALAFVEGQASARDRLVARAAYQEYQTFKASPCTYQPPTAPSTVEDPETVPKKVTDWCKLPTTQASEAFAFVPPLPTPSQFTAWGSYRNSDELGLEAFENPVTRKNLVDVSVAAAVGGGFAMAGLTGGAVFATASALPSIAAFGKLIFPHVGRIAYQAAKGLSELAAKAVTRAAQAVAGTIAAAVIAVAVVVFLVVTGVSIYLLIQHESVSQTLRDRVDVTAKSTDPFGLQPYADDLSGQPLNSALDPANPPSYRASEAHATMASWVTRWTTEYHEDVLPELRGTTQPDPSGLWDDNATTVADFRWQVRVGGADPVERRTLSVPHVTGSAQIRFSRGWPIVDPPDGPAYAALQFGYIDDFGAPRLMTRDPSAPNRFISTTTDSGGFAEQRTTLTFLNEDGQTVQARLLGRAPTYLAGPRPAAVGPLIAGRPVLLRPNPVGVTGGSLNDTVVQEDYLFDWTVERLDDSTGQWGVVHTANTYGSSLLPTQPGQYDARVTMTSVDDSTQKQYGSVRFEVTAPPINPAVAQLVDNGFDRLELDLQFTEDVPSDNIQIDVTWPGNIGSATNPVETSTVSCDQTGPVDCTTARTGPLDALVFPVSSRTDLRRPVKVVVTNTTGASFETEFLLGEGRPVAESPPAGANDAEPGTVLVGESSTQVTMPLDSAAGVQEYVAATLSPSPGGGQDFGLVDPATGNTTAGILLPGLRQGVAEVFENPGTGTWYVAVRGIPDVRDLGSFEVPLIVAQTNGTRQLLSVVAHVVPSTEDRFRAAIQTDVDPDDFGVDTLPEMYPMILGGTVLDARYSGRMCVSVEFSNFPSPIQERCGPVSDFFTSAGVARPLPFAKLYPTGMPAGLYRAETWLATPGSRVDTAPLRTSFFLNQSATYPAPKVGLGSIDILGQTVVGAELRATVASVDPKGAKLRYQWLRNGIAINGATGRRYLLTPRDRGALISVRIRASYPDWTSTKKTSAATPLIR